MGSDAQIKPNQCPLVSIIVTCYNHEKYIGECIKSLLEQTYFNIEILITDDCSKDNSPHIIQNWTEKLKQRFAKVIYIQNKENIGAVRSLNQMLRISRGDYIKLLDGDDMLFPNAIEDLTVFLEEKKVYGLVYSNHVSCETDESFNLEELRKKEIQKAPVVYKHMSQKLYENDFIIAPTVLIRRKVYEQIGLHDENISIADWEFWIRASFDFEIGYLDKVTAVYRIVPDSMSRFTMDIAGRKRLQTMIENELYILDKFKEYPSINSRKGIRKCCNQGISIAIDLKAADTIAYIRKYLRKSKGALSIKMELKYFLYRMHVWELIKKITV